MEKLKEGQRWGGRKKDCKKKIVKERKKEKIEKKTRDEEMAQKMRKRDDII